MIEITNNLSSLAWWFSAVVVGILASLVAAYLKPATDFAVKFTLEALSLKRLKSEKIRKQLADKINADADYRGLIAHAELRAYAIGIAMIMMGAIFFALFVLLTHSPVWSEGRKWANYSAGFSLILFCFAAKEFAAGYVLSYALALAARERMKI